MSEVVQKKCMMLIPRLCNGGAERVMTTLANGLCNDMQVKIVTLTDDECFYPLDERVSVKGLGGNVNRKNKIAKAFSSVFGGLKCFCRLRKTIKEYKPDTVISFLQSANGFIIMGKMLWGLKCKIIVSERCDPLARSRFNRWFERNFYHKADVIVCQGEKAASFFKEKHRKKVVIIPNPVNAKAIPPLYTGERRKSIVGVGRLDGQKNFPLLINAFAKLSDKFSDYNLEIYGGGTDQQKLQSLINDLGIQDRATLMGVKKNVFYSVADASLFVMSSDFEGFPNVLVEAMSSGLPVISTNFPTGIAQDIVKEENGIVIPVGDEKALVSAMEELLSNPERREKMSVENRKVLVQLNEESIIEKWKKIM